VVVWPTYQTTIEYRVCTALKEDKAPLKAPMGGFLPQLTMKLSFEIRPQFIKFPILLF